MSTLILSKKNIDYSETARPINRGNRSSRSSTSSRQSVSSMANSDDEENKNHRTKAVKRPERTASKRAAKPFREETAPARSSMRIIAARTEAKRPKYAEDLSSDEGGSDSETE